MTYQSLIADAIGTQDDATVTLIETIMRCSRPVLDALTPAEFRALARHSVHEAGVLSVSPAERGTWLEAFCLAHQIDLPAHGPMTAALRHAGVRDIPAS